MPIPAITGYRFSRAVQCCVNTLGQPHGVTMCGFFQNLKTSELKRNECVVQYENRFIATLPISTGKSEGDYYKILYSLNSDGVADCYIVLPKPFACKENPCKILKHTV